MGSFFTNVQVYVGDRPAHDLRSAIIGAMQRLVRDDGFVEVDPDDATAERMLLIGPADATRWIAVYDSATEGQDQTQLDALAAALSTVSEGAAVGVLIHDSDVLELRLWHSGARLDSYSSSPDYYGLVSRKQR